MGFRGSNPDLYLEFHLGGELGWVQHQDDVLALDVSVEVVSHTQQEVRLLCKMDEEPVYRPLQQVLANALGMAFLFFALFSERK